MQQHSNHEKRRQQRDFLVFRIIQNGIPLPTPREGSLENLSPAHVGKKSFHFKMTKQREENFINGSPSPSGIKGISQQQQKKQNCFLSPSVWGIIFYCHSSSKKEFPTANPANEMTWQKLTINLIRSEFRSINLDTEFEIL